MHNPDGTTDREEYTYEVEVEYAYHILNVTLTNASMESVVNEIGFTEDQMERYLLLKETYGNKKYLFEDDIYANPEADSGGSSSGTSGGESYKPSGEALTDTQFAAMWQEASKYLGRAYVWTGFDCSGFVCWVINHSGVGNVGRTTAEGLRQWTDPIPASERQPGDIIYFQGTYDTPGASHVGIYIGDGKMIHCGDPIKVSNVDSGYFKQHFLGAAFSGLRENSVRTDVKRSIGTYYPKSVGSSRTAEKRKMTLLTGVRGGVLWSPFLMEENECTKNSTSCARK